MLRLQPTASPPEAAPADTDQQTPGPNRSAALAASRATIATTLLMRMDASVATLEVQVTWLDELPKLLGMADELTRRSCASPLRALRSDLGRLVAAIERRTAMLEAAETQCRAGLGKLG